MIENTFISLNNVDKLPLKLKFLEIYKINSIHSHEYQPELPRNAYR